MVILQEDALKYALLPPDPAVSPAHTWECVQSTLWDILPMLGRKKKMGNKKIIILNFLNYCNFVTVQFSD